MITISRAEAELSYGITFYNAYFGSNHETKQGGLLAAVPVTVLQAGPICSGVSCGSIEILSGQTAGSWIVSRGSYGYGNSEAAQTPWRARARSYCPF